LPVCADKQPRHRQPGDRAGYFEFTQFKENGGIVKVFQMCGEDLWPMLEELNEVLAA
jgi:hypothetical protein